MFLIPEFSLFFLLASDEVLSDESQIPHPPTLFSHAFGISDLVLWHEA